MGADSTYDSLYVFGITFSVYNLSEPQNWVCHLGGIWSGKHHHHYHSIPTSPHQENMKLLNSYLNLLNLLNLKLSKKMLN